MGINEPQREREGGGIHHFMSRPLVGFLVLTREKRNVLFDCALGLFFLVDTQSSQQKHQSEAEPSGDEDGPHFIKDVVPIPHECVGCAMGRQGWNINQARQVDGVISIEFDDYKSEFTIKAEVSQWFGKEGIPTCNNGRLILTFAE